MVKCEKSSSFLQRDLSEGTFDISVHPLTPSSQSSFAFRRHSGCSKASAIDCLRNGAFEIFQRDLTFYGHKLGEGSMSIVHRAEWRGRRCAAKMLKQGITEDSVEYQDFISEMCLLASVTPHPNLVAFYGACIENPTTPIILQELVDGTNLQDYFDSKHAGFNLGRSTVYRWSRDLLSALHHLHDRDPLIMHRDLKPSNILVTQDLTRLKLADFGLAKQLWRQERMCLAHAQSTGTLRYMAPEVFGHVVAGQENIIVLGGVGAVYTEKADIYSAALVIWTMLTGITPYIRIADNPLGRPNTAAARARWPGLASLIERMWQHEAERRPSAKACLARLGSFACSGLRTGLAVGLGGLAQRVAGGAAALPKCLSPKPADDSDDAFDSESRLSRDLFLSS